MSQPFARHYLLASEVHAAPLTIPEGKRPPFGWPVFGLSAAAADDGTPAVLRWPAAVDRGAAPNSAARLRLTIGLDVREVKLVEVTLAESGRPLGRFDLRFSSVFQPYEIALPAGDAEAAMREGVALRQVAGEQPLWLLGPGRGSIADKPTIDVLQPHITFDADWSEDRMSTVLEHVASIGGVQMFGWKEGCVLDALADLRDTLPGAVERHLRYFQGSDRQLVFENERSVVVDGTVPGTEFPLPFAVIARHDPKHPSLAGAIDFTRQWSQRHEREDLADGPTCTTESCYTLAYPMLAMAHACQQHDLIALALGVLRLRRRYNVVDGDIYQKATRTGDRRLRNWARGVAWYLLGHVRCIMELDRLGHTRETDDLRRAFHEAAQWALTHQLSDGQWRCFIDDASTEPDTSGSAGIAAAVALGVRHGLLDASCRDAAIGARDALVARLTPDGLLPGVAQDNKGGEELQRSAYRVISQMGMGLLAQLIAAMR